MTDWLKPNAGWLLFILSLCLVGVGLAAIDTADVYDGGYRAKQIQFLGVSIFAMIVVAIPHHRLISRMSLPLMVASLVLLVFVLLPFAPDSLVPTRNGAKRWINLKVVMFQPSELAKLSFVIALARYLRYRKNYRTLKGLLVPFLITFLPVGLILVEPDLGTSMLFFPILFAMLIAAGAKLRHLALIVLLGILAVPVMYPMLRPHQKARIRALVSQLMGDTSTDQNISYQGSKARTIVGSGKVLGYGADRASTIIKFNALPERHNDMIFAVICARWGMKGGMGVLMLYLLWIGCGLRIAGATKDPFARLVAVGMLTIVFTQMFVNVGMTIGLLPITGMTLPFVSYGGSSLLISFLMVGILVNLAARRPLIMGSSSFEHEHSGTPAIKAKL